MKRAEKDEKKKTQRIMKLRDKGKIKNWVIYQIKSLFQARNLQ